jgi:hypothetical protein
MSIKASLVSWRIVLSFFVALASHASLAQESFHDATGEQVRFYKLGVETGCRDQGRRKEDKNAEAFCSCIMEVLNANMSYEEWQKAYYFSRKRQDRKEMQVLSPHMAKVGVCKPNKS